ncbi:hypothetical protein G7Z17_g5366 [Cylindrodendrum hubeiense]|uniref:J domain-containing protein n=1 Tax=Cylindrodendrum hubeiense TaxID=595255 RepID=A0A9P5L954_9HYPO|nr:hypothetical protein G7Z17_g5366 [Cylindrodendrum hubeiense]
MAPPPFTIDYYAVLEVPQTADDATIKSAYRRLARLKHPDKNENSPQATVEFQILQAAYATLSDTSQRRRFDRQYLAAARPKKCPNARWHFASSQNYFASTQNYFTHEEPQAKPRHVRPPPQTDKSRAYGAKSDQLDREIQHMEATKRKLQGDHFETIRKINRKESTLRRLQVEDDQDAQEDALRELFSGYSLLPELSAEEIEARNRRASGRRTGRIVLETALRKCESDLDAIESRLNIISAKIQEKNVKRDVLNRRKEEARLVEKEAKRAAEEARRVAEARLAAKEVVRAERERRERIRQDLEERKARVEQIRRARQDLENRRREQQEKNAERDWATGRPQTSYRDVSVLSRLTGIESRLQALEGEGGDGTELDLPSKDPTQGNRGPVRSTIPDLHTASAQKMLHCWPRIRLNLTLPGVISTTFLRESDAADPWLLETATSSHDAPQIFLWQVADAMDHFYAMSYTDLPLFVSELFDLCKPLSHSSIMRSFTPESPSPNTGSPHSAPIDFERLSIPQLLLLSLAKTQLADDMVTDNSSARSVPAHAFTIVLQKQWVLLSQPDEERVPLVLMTAYCLVYFWARPFHALGLLQAIDPAIKGYSLKHLGHE